MRKKNQKQMPLMPIDIERLRGQKLARISGILDSIITSTEVILQDPTHSVKL